MEKKKVKKNRTAKEESQEEVRQDKSRIDKELYWTLSIMVGLIIVFLVSYSVFQSMRSFEYKGLTFTKEKFGEIPIYRYYYFTKSVVSGKVTSEPVQYNLLLRIDPRKNDVPVEGEIVMLLDRLTYISVNPENLTQCEYSAPAIGTLTSFLIGNLVSVKGATTSETLANETNTIYATCETHAANIVIVIQADEETKVTKENSGCYTISVANCEVLNAVEKFIVQSILDARERKGL